MIVYYTHYLIIFPKYIGRNFLNLIVSSFTVFVFLLFIKYTEVYYIATIWGGTSDFEGAPFYELGSILLIFFLIIITMALGAFQTKKSVFQIQFQHERERVLLTMNLGFLQNQFNPHITFNLLNYCYKHSLNKSKEVANVIELFSNMLRHSIANKSNEPIALKYEVNYISDFINLHKELDNAIQIDFTISGEIENQKIFPRILICFIENAIKHGEIYSSEFPVNVEIKISKKNFKLIVHNKKRATPLKHKKTSVGLKNITQQLEINYRNRYDLKISNLNDSYLSVLSLCLD
jgi:two-component system, LytTR family, sensor kinase